MLVEHGQKWVWPVWLHNSEIDFISRMIFGWVWSEMGMAI